jgi:hypothetical protein
MAETVPHITQNNWGVNGDVLIAWITDLELFDIAPSDTTMDLWVLRYNHVGTARYSFLGVYGSIEDAQGAARTWLGYDE